jgi:hypothetical protein
VEDGIGGVVVPLGGQTGGLPDRADGVWTAADDPSGDQGLKGGEDLGVEASAERLYQSSEAGDKLIHRADLRAVRDPGELEYPSGYRHSA